MNANYEAMAAKYGEEEARRRMEEIIDLSGAGSGKVPYDYVGGVDVLGALAESNTSLTDKAKARIAELSGIGRKDVDKKFEEGRKAVAEGVRSKDFVHPPDMAMDVNRK